MRVSQETKISVRFAFLLPAHLCKIDTIFYKKYPKNSQIYIVTTQINTSLTDNFFPVFLCIDDPHIECFYTRKCSDVFKISTVVITFSAKI